MAKTFSKIVLASTIIAGAAVGAYAYLKEKGMTSPDASDSDGDHPISDAASDILNTERNYVDLTTLKAAAENVVEKAKGAVAEAKEALSEVAGEVKAKVAESSAEAKEVVAEAVEDVAEETSEVIAEAKDAVEESVEDVKEEICDAAEDANEEFKEGLDATKIELTDHVVNPTSSEEFFDDEDEQ